MFPLSTRNDVADGGFRYSENHRQPDQTHALLCVKESQFSHLGFIQSRNWIRASEHWWKLVPLCATLFHHVLRILFWSARKEMRRVAARRVVAFVQNPQSFWNWAYSHFISNPVRLMRLSVYGKNSMSVVALCFFVRPAVVRPARSVNIIPNVLFRICFWHKESAHQLESKVRKPVAAIEPMGAKQFMVFLTATLMPRKSYTNFGLRSTI
jgi:hypothetical protein